MFRHTIPFAIALLVSGSLSVLSVSAQTRIEIGQRIDGTIIPRQAASEFIFAGTGGTLLTVMCEAPDRNVVLTVSLYDPFGNQIGVNNGRNFPEYFGAYLAVVLPSSSDFTIRVEGALLTEEASAAFRLTTREYDSDEKDGTAIYRDTTVEGLLAPNGDTDIYAIYLNQSKSPVWVTLRTPHDILDGYLSVYSENWDLLGSNDDLVDTSPAVLFHPTVSQIYWIVVQGSYWDSVGPYALTVQSVWEVGLEDSFPDEIFNVGESVAYFFELGADQVVSIEAKGLTPGFHPTFVFFDPWDQVAAIDQASGAVDAAGVYGYTPVSPGLYVGVVFGAQDEETGEFQLTSHLESDEPENRPVTPGEDVQAILGPAGDTDTFSFEGSSGNRVSVWVRPTGSMTFKLDPEVRLLNPSGKVAAENDNAVSVQGSLISGVFLQETGLYTVEVSASPLLPDATSAAGPYILAVTEGTAFDLTPPRISYAGIDYEYSAGEARITLGSETIRDDTWPLNATLTLDRTTESQTASLPRDHDTLFVFPARPEDVFFLTVEDAADSPHVTNPFIIPPAESVVKQVGSPFGLAVRDTGEILFIDTSRGLIGRLDATENPFTMVKGIETRGGILGPNALALDHEGQLYLSNASTGEIVRYDIHNATETVVSGLNFPISLAFDALDRLYVCLLGDDTVARVESDGSQTTLTHEIRNPSDLAFGPNGELYVTSNNADNSTVYRVNADGAATELVKPFATQLDSIAVDTEGNLYMADGAEGWIWRLGVDGRLQKFAWGFSGPTDIAFGRGDQSDMLYVASMGATWTSDFSPGIARLRTGKHGLSLPFSSTGVLNWRLY